MNTLDATHDPSLTSWVESAQSDGTDFPIQNLPFGVFRRGRGDAEVGVAIGSDVLALTPLVGAGWLGQDAQVHHAVAQGTLNALLELSEAQTRDLRRRISALLSASNGALRDAASQRASCIVPQSDVEMLMPVTVGDYTDFYASVHHATNVGSMFRPDNPLLPNYKFIPVGYHGRASSLVVGGTPVRRPWGQQKADDADAPTFAPCRLFDYEVEVGFYVRGDNDLGSSVNIAEAEGRIFGLSLVNDWSARDLQKWEYQPLGPFLAKSFATSVAPWVVTLDALAPFRVSAFERPAGDPQPLPHLDHAVNRNTGAVDMQVEAWLLTPQMRAAKHEPVRLSRGHFRDMYWTIAQMLTHHASNGCNMRAGDLLASGTVSGPEKGNRGCLLELTWRGSEPVQLPTGEERRFLIDGDELILKGYCESKSHRRIGFGECRGVVVEALPA